MKRWSVICVMVVLVVAILSICWRPAVATPKTGLTERAREELMQTLGK